MMVLQDAYGRPLLNLRMAITRRCNLNCQFCHMEGEETAERISSGEMTVDEIVQIARVAVGLGIAKLKLTGGEPLVRSDISRIIEGIAAIRGLTDLSMTTNGTLLAPLAKELRTKGLRRVNISLPTLDAKAYRKLTGGKLEQVLDGIEAAVNVGFSPVKLNILVLKSADNHDLSAMIDFAKKTGTILQLIELEQVNISDEYYSANHKTLDKYESMLKQEALKVETRRHMQNRRIYHLPDSKVEVIHPTENAEFCMHCTRLRVTSDGKLKTCLMRNDHLIDVLTSIRNGASDRELAELFKQANCKRQPYNMIKDGKGRQN